MTEFSCEAIWPWPFVFFWENFWSQHQFQCLFKFLLLHDSVLGDRPFLRICPFIPGHPFYCHIVVNNSLIILCISALSVVTSPFSFISTQIFMISFLLLIWGVFVLLFPVVLGIKLSCLFDVFLVFKLGLYCCTLPS